MYNTTQTVAAYPGSNIRRVVAEKSTWVVVWDEIRQGIFAHRTIHRNEAIKTLVV